jgi:hypothetical protein
MRIDLDSARRFSFVSTDVFEEKDERMDRFQRIQRVLVEGVKVVLTVSALCP